MLDQLWNHMLLMKKKIRSHRQGASGALIEFNRSVPVGFPLGFFSLVPAHVHSLLNRYTSHTWLID